MEASEQQQHFWRQDRLIKWLMNLACTKKVGGRRRGRKKSNKTAVALKKMRGSVQKGGQKKSSLKYCKMICLEENRPMPKRGQTTKKCKKCCGKTTFGVSGAVKPLQNPRSSSKECLFAFGHLKSTNLTVPFSFIEEDEKQCKTPGENFIKDANDFADPRKWSGACIDRRVPRAALLHLPPAIQ